MAYTPSYDGSGLVVLTTAEVRSNLDDAIGYASEFGLEAQLASDKALYVLDAAGRKTYKLKHRLPLDKLRVVVTNENDTLVLVKIPQELKKDKGDLIISVSNLIEALTIVTDYTKKTELIEIVDTRTIAHNLVNGKQGGTIEVQNGPQANIHRAKSGNLLVIATP